MLFAVVVIIGAWYAFRPERLVVNRTVNEALPTSQGASSLVPLESGTFYSILHPTQGAAPSTSWAMALEGCTTRPRRWNPFSVASGRS